VCLWLFLVVGFFGGGGRIFRLSVLEVTVTNFLFLFPSAKGLADFLSMKLILLVILGDKCCACSNAWCPFGGRKGGRGLLWWCQWRAGDQR
jgi:hypothetical protein